MIYRTLVAEVLRGSSLRLNAAAIVSRLQAKLMDFRSDLTGSSDWNCSSNEGKRRYGSISFRLDDFPDSFPETYFTCPKCGNYIYEIEQIRVSGGFWRSFFDVGNKLYGDVSCKEGGYNEFYKKAVSGIQKVFDFLGS